MTDALQSSLVEWSRAQFALTAIYHWLFVPLTLGLGFLVAIMETIYVKTGDPEWKKLTKFWMTLFGINFAIGVATGIILEFEFGTNWSNYSWFVGDIFGAPLAIEGILAFFLESTFIALMFFGWNKLSKKTHLAATWLTAFGANLSALWILVANAWMQAPVGMRFNPDTARNEMANFWEVLFSPMAVHKFLHTVTSGYVLAAVFVIAVSSWYLLKKRHQVMAKRSIVVASVFGLMSIIGNIFWGDASAREVAHRQPMKFAAFEGLYSGSKGVGLTTIGVVSASPGDSTFANYTDYSFKIEIPNMLSYLAYKDFGAFVPGIKDLVNGNESQGIPPVMEKVRKGKMAINALADYKKAKQDNDTLKTREALNTLNENYAFFGYGYFDNPYDLVPNVPLTFYSFRIMVALGFWFFILFAAFLVLMAKNKLEHSKIWLISALVSLPLAYLASQMGWITAEVGRQPWVIQDLLPTHAAISNISSTSVQITFWLFAVIFTLLLIAEIKIMTRQIKLGPKDGGPDHV
ncbi:MAG: cytochrome ubiquinol oxidase subunit I [Bacteroidales bacterium]